MMQLLTSGSDMPPVSELATLHHDVNSGKLAEKIGVANVVPWWGNIIHWFRAGGCTWPLGGCANG